ncbi:unnamed protein product [Chondrus crispus]|uniref:Uncharacterized protein n=1 Tax=Chondrus crispus TaxID=2769 RepID=R7Q9J8_CHOCR|nr:unnamed protein product [Chondrus crispus]CDF34734.1 unnamed protein product [Chondrus crispus]|eukprot:XP_005714553.1 unnamed protein product [Chondrus crispus]
MMDVACSVMSIRASPARAKSVASTTPSDNLRKRVCTFPRKLTTFKDGFLAKIWLCRRRLADPMTLPSGSSSMVLALFEMNTSLVSSLGSMHGRQIPSGSHVGTSFMEWTAISISLFSWATSISLVNKPFPPISDSALSRTMSPVVWMTRISMPPSSASSGKASMSRLWVSRAWASASGEPRVPMTMVARPDAFLVSSTATSDTLMRGWRRALGGAAGAHAGVCGDRRGDRGEVADARCCRESGTGAQKAAGGMVSRIRRRVVTVAPGGVGNGAGKVDGEIGRRCGRDSSSKVRGGGRLGGQLFEGLWRSRIHAISWRYLPHQDQRAPRFSPLRHACALYLYCSAV